MERVTIRWIGDEAPMLVVYWSTIFLRVFERQGMEAYFSTVVAYHACDARQGVPCFLARSAIVLSQRHPGSRGVDVRAMAAPTTQVMATGAKALPPPVAIALRSRCTTGTTCVYPNY